MLTTVPFDRLSLRRLPWVTFALALLWVGGFVYASSTGQGLALETHRVTAAGLLGHWIFPATGAQLLMGTLLLWIVGPVLEEAWGPAFFAAFVLAMALYTGGAYAAFPPGSERPLVGGSGLLAAALAACIARQWKDGIAYTVVYWQRELRHLELRVPAYTLPGVWFAGEVVMELAADGVGPTRGLSYSGQLAGAALGALVGFGLRHYGLEQSWLRRRPADAPDPVVENARLLARGGSPEAALRLLAPAVARRPHDPELVSGLCEVALAAQEPEAARAALSACITHHLKSGEASAAASLWKQWAERIGGPDLDGRMALPLAQALVSRDALAAARLLRDLLDAPERISTGMALRIVEIARPVHAGVAIRAAHLALEGGDFPEAKRARLEAVVRELESRRSEQLDPELEPKVPSGLPDRSIEIALEEEDLSRPPADFQSARPQAIDLPSDWPQEDAGSLVDATASGATTASAPDEREALFGSSDEMELAAPDALIDTEPILQTRPVGVASRPAQPGDRSTTARTLMPVTPEPAAPEPSAPDPEQTLPPSAADPEQTLPPSAAPPPVRSHAARPSPPIPDETGSAVAVAEPRFQDAKCIEAVPVGWQPGRISLRQGSAAPGWLELSRVQAVASAGVSGLAARPVVVIDLLLNWRDVSEAPLRVVRLRSDRFDPSRLLPGNIGGLDGFRAVLDALLEQSGATPLPDARGARGRPFVRFDSLERYEREVLGIDR